MRLHSLLFERLRMSHSQGTQDKGVIYLHWIDLYYLEQLKRVFFQAARIGSNSVIAVAVKANLSLLTSLIVFLPSDFKIVLPFPT